MTTISVDINRNGVHFRNEIEMKRFGPNDLEELSAHIVKTLRKLLSKTGETGWEEPVETVKR
jgi:hypothetical protein